MKHNTNSVDKIGYTICNGTMVPNLKDIVAYISESAIQADWEQTDPTAKSFIKNKPDLNLLATKVELNEEAQIREEADNDLSSELNECFVTLTQTENQLKLTKKNGEERIYEPTIPAAMQFKGGCFQADLPTTGQVDGDYWALQDTEEPYMGKSAIWNGSLWTYVGTTIAVEQTVQEGSTTAVSGGAVFEQSRQIIQTIYNAIYPVRCRVIGFDAPSIPAGVEASWEIDDDYNGKYLYVDSGQAAGTSIAEEAVIEETVLTTEQIPSHNHNIQHNHGRGSMEITGYFAIAPSMSGRTGDTLPIKKISGAFYNAGNSGGATARIDDIDATYTRSASPNVVGFKASDKWTGVTSGPWNSSGNPIINSGSTGGGEGHTHNIGHIKTAGVVVNVWKRTS